MSLTEKIISRFSPKSLEGLRQVDALWHQLRHQSPSVTAVIQYSSEILINLDWDVVISGGTLGILLAAALQMKGWKVLLLERGKLQGREQEWNISRQELQVLVELELLSEAELTRAIATTYNPARVGFYKGYELWVNDVLNIGVDPVFLLDILKQKFLDAQGTLLENTPFITATVHPNGVTVQGQNTQITTRLFIDAMGHFSPIVKQARQGQNPDGICLVVGSCGQGYEQNETGDLIYTFTPILNQCQYFWEAFPAKDGRTTYLFTYLDPHRDRFSLEFLMEEYFRLLPEYQNIDLERLKFKRFLFGFFPSYRNSPTRFPWDRILPVGDSSGSQSPVSFGGFGAMIRHLQRLTTGINEALQADVLSQQGLSLLQPYQPNISVTWLFQKTMSVDVKITITNPNQINDLMSAVFAVMDDLGDEILKPFLQDVIQFSPLAKTLFSVNPKVVLPLLPQIGVYPFLDWTIHYVNLARYTGLYPLGKIFNPLLHNLSPSQQYYYHRWLDQWQYGAGLDYHS